LEYVKGSHLWKESPAIDRGDFHANKQGYRSQVYRAAEEAGVDPSSIGFDCIVAPAGSLVIHDGRLWHGSAANTSPDVWRRSIGIHCIGAENKHKPNGGYIYSRYQRYGSDELDDAFFPILYGQGEYSRSPFLKEYLDLKDYPRNY